jgi:hypothetical protein
MAMTSSRSAGTIDLKETLCPETKKPQEAIDSCGSVAEAMRQSFLLAIARLPLVLFSF